MSRRNVVKADPNDWAAKRKAQIELAKQKREERAMMGDECTEEHTFQPKVNPRPKYLERNRHDSADSLDMLAGGGGGQQQQNDIFEQPLPGSKPRAASRGVGGVRDMGGMENPPSPSSDALGNEMKRFPHQQQQPQLQQHQSYPNNQSLQQHQPQLRQHQSYPSKEPPSQSPYKSKFMQQYDNQANGNSQITNTTSNTTVADDVDSNFFNSLRNDGDASGGGSGWNNDTSTAEIPSLGPPKRKVSYRRRKTTDNPDRQYPPTPTFSSNRKPAIQQSQSHDPAPWNNDVEEFDPNSVPPSHVGNRNNAKSTPTSMTNTDDDQGFIGNQTGPRRTGDIGQARSRLSLLKTKMRRSDSGSHLTRPNNGEATNLPKYNSPKQKSAPPRRVQQQDFEQAESGWNNDFTDSNIPDVPQPKANRRRQNHQQQRHQQQQQHYEAESGWNNDFSDAPIPDVPPPRNNRRQQVQQHDDYSSGRGASGGYSSKRPPQKQQPTRWNNSTDMEDDNDMGSSSVPTSAAGYRDSHMTDQQQQRKPARQSAPRSQQHQQQEYQPPPQQQQQQRQQYQQPPPQQQQFQQQLPPDAYPPSNDPFGSGMENTSVGEQKQCPDCGRKFNPIPFERHVKICAKVFVEKRKAFDSKKMRIESVAAENPDLVKVLKEKAKEERMEKKKGKKPQSERAIAAANKQAKWKAESNALREAMRANKKVAHALATGGPMPEQVASAPDPSLVPCPNCGRSFNEKAAARHIPLCKNIKAKPTSLKRGTGGAGGKTGGPKTVTGNNKTGGSRR